MALLKVKHLFKKYTNKSEFTVKDISIHGDAGEIVGILGHNGAGKSTLIKSIVGLHPYQKGEITICGFDLMKNPIQAKQNFGYVSDEFDLLDRMTGIEYINFMADIYGVSAKERKVRIEEMQNIMNLGEAINKQILSYSHGMKQKISVMGALIHNPKVFILDEPMTGLDPNMANQLKQYFIRHAKEGNLVIFSSHNLDVVEDLCDRAYVIDKGVVKTEIDLKKFREEGKDLEKYFLNLTKK